MFSDVREGLFLMEERRKKKERLYLLRIARDSAQTLINLWSSKWYTELLSTVMQSHVCVLHTFEVPCESNTQSAENKRLKIGMLLDIVNKNKLWH